MKRPINPKFAPPVRSDADARFLKTITDTGHCPNFDAGIEADEVPEGSKIEWVIRAEPNSFARTRRHRIPHPVQDKRIQK